MAASLRDQRTPVSVNPAKRGERPHLRLVPPSGSITSAGALSFVLFVVVLGLLSVIYDRLRALEEEREDRIDVEVARKALAEEGSVSLADLKAELGL